MTPREASTIVDRFARDEEIDELLVDLLRSPSPQAEGLEADSQLKKFISDKVAPRLTGLTGSAGAIDAMGNLIWRTGGASSDGLLLMGYAMTYPAASMQQPYSGALIDGAAFGVAGRCALGRGACEQKGALTGMIYAVALVARAQIALRAPLTLAVSLAGETGRHDAAEFMLKNDGISARSAIVGLGTGNRICLGQQGPDRRRRRRARQVRAQQHARAGRQRRGRVSPGDGTVGAAAAGDRSSRSRQRHSDGDASHKRSRHQPYDPRRMSRRAGSTAFARRRSRRGVSRYSGCPQRCNRLGHQCLARLLHAPFGSCARLRATDCDGRLHS